MAPPGTFSRSLLSVALTLLVAPAFAQLPAPPATAEDALHQMADQAGIIFTGQMSAIRYPRSAPGSTGVVEIDFAVTDSVLGPPAGSTYALREWAGLWPAGDTPFTVGRRYLMLLHAPGPSGLSSPVGGQDGAIPILGTGTAASPQTTDTSAATPAPRILTPSQPEPAASTGPPVRSALRLSTLSDAPTLSDGLTSSGSMTIDLRWVATRVLIPTASPSAPIARANLTLAPASPATSSPSAEMPAPPSSAAYSSVLAQLRSWESSRAAH